jgi:hypothetical protein
MGLDGVEIIMGWENAFGIRIADKDAGQLRTTRMAFDLIGKMVNASDASAPYCLTARAFYKLRQSLGAVTGVPRAAVLPASKIRDVFKGPDRKTHWRAVGERLGTPKLPPFGPALSWIISPKSVREMAEWLVVNCPRIFLGPDERWSRGHVRTIVRTVISDVTGIKKFSDDADFVHDLRID